MMKPRKLGLAAASLLGAATMLAGPAPAHADDACIVCPDKPGADPFVKIEDALLKVDGVLGKWTPDDTPFHKLDTAVGKIDGLLDKY